MTYALIDNSTLTAIQRLSGQVLTKSKDSVDIDIIALENLVQSILFYDRIIAIDDYIKKFREERISKFPFITFLNVDKFKLRPIAKKAAEIAEEIKPEIRGGEFANDDFRNLIELLQTHIICTWDISSSIYYLTLKCLAKSDSTYFQKYSKLAASIFAELADATETGNRVSSNVKLIDRFGNPITPGYKIPGARWGDGSTGGTTGAIRAFVAALTWLANRSIFYSLSAKYLHADTFLFPIRQAYQQYYISKTCGYSLNYPKHIVEYFSTHINEDLLEISNGGLSVATAIDLPVFSAWLALETGDPASIVDAAFELRDEEEFIEARSQLREIRNHFDSNDIAKANKSVRKIINDINKVSTYIRRKYRIETAQGIPITRFVQVYNTYAAVRGLPTIPEFDFKVKLPEFLENLRRDSGFAAIYRNISMDLSQVWALGEARDILGARVIKDKDAITYNPKSEAPEYRNIHSQFKSPM